jgi:peptidoglycan/LPS O-acetylase OafA/YrhL
MKQSFNVSKPASRSSTFRADIQGLRALAIILVIGLHMGLAGFQAGYVGVDIFFVISGYVITLSLNKQPAKHTWANLAIFWGSRFIRIFPAAALVVATTIVAAYFLQGLAFNSDLITDARWATFYATNLRLIDSGANYFIVGLDQSLLTHFWALAVEQQFYLVFPVLVFSLTWLSSEKYRILLLQIALVLIVIASAIWSVLEAGTNAVSAYFSPFTRFWELGVGALVATFAFTKAPKWLSYLGLVTIVASLFLFDSATLYPGYLAWVPVLGTALVLISPLPALGIRPLRYIGDISYSLYLWHYLWLVLPTQLENPITDGYWSWLFLLGAVMTAVLSYHFFERPIHKSVTLRSDRYSAFVIGAICIVSALLAIAIIENLYLRSIS